MEPKKKLNIPQLAGIIAGIGVVFAVQLIFFKTPSFDRGMMQAASELNKTCPIMVDKETRLDNAVALPDKIFQYNYTLINIEKDNIDIKALEDYLEPILINGVKTSPELKIYRENKITMAYNYKDKNGEFLFKISVTPGKYLNDYPKDNSSGQTI